MSNRQSIDNILSQAVASKAMPGIVAVAATDRGVLYEGAFGTRELGKDAPMTLDTVVWIASMTKAITATAAMQLVERGKLDLERPASEVVRELATAKVLDGFDAAGKPRLRAPKRPITFATSSPIPRDSPTRSGPRRSPNIKPPRARQVSRPARTPR